MGTKRIQFFGILILFMASLCLAEAGDMTMSANIKLKDGKYIGFGSGGSQARLVFISYEGSDNIEVTNTHLDFVSSGSGYLRFLNSAKTYYTGLKGAGDILQDLVFTLPSNYGGAGGVLTSGGDGSLVWQMPTDWGYITQVWTDFDGDVSALTAAPDDTLNASSAGSTIPWKVSTTANPTTEGMAVWDSDDDRLAIGDGTSTYYIQLDGNLTIESSSIVNQDLTTDASVTFNDITVSTPSNIYSLDHDSFSGFVENEHIDWTNATSSLVTTGTGTFENVHISSGETYDTILEAANAALTADRTLTFNLSNSNTTLTFNGSPTIGDWFDQSVKTTSSPTFDSPYLTGLTFNWTDDYLFTKRTGDYLAIQCQTSGADSIVELFSKEGLSTDNVLLQIWGKGLPSQINNRELLGIGYLVADTRFVIVSAYAGTSTPRDLALYTQGNTDQLLLATNGNCSMSGALAVSSTVSGGGLQTAANIGIPTDTDILQLSTGTVEITVGNIDLYQAEHNFNCLGDVKFNIDTENKDFVVNLNQAGTTFDIHNGSSLFTVDRNGDAQLSGSFVIGDGEYIGSTSDTDAIQIEADGDVVLTQDLYVTAITGSDLFTINQSADSDGLQINGFDDRSGEYLQANVSSGGAGTLKSSSNLYLQSALGALLFYPAANSDIWMKLGDAAGAEKIIVQDSAYATVATIDSDGNIDGTSFSVAGDDGVSGTLELDDGTTEKITLVFTGGILTSRTVAATTGSALADWTD